MPGMYEGKEFNSIEDVIKYITEQHKTQMAQVEATKERTGKEALSIATNMLDGASSVIQQDQNVQAMIFASVPYGAAEDGKPLNSYGFSSNLWCAMSVVAAHNFLHGHVPHLVKEYKFSMKDRIILAWRILTTRANLPDSNAPTPLAMYDNGGDRKSGIIRKGGNK